MFTPVKYSWLLVVTKLKNVLGIYPIFFLSPEDHFRLNMAIEDGQKCFYMKGLRLASLDMRNPGFYFYFFSIFSIVILFSNLFLILMLFFILLFTFYFFFNLESRVQSRFCTMPKIFLYLDIS